MITVQLEAYSWISASMGMPESGRQIISRKLKPGAVLSDLFQELAGDYPEFSRQVFNPNTGWISDEIMVIMNHKLIQVPEFAKTVLKDNDQISLSPVLVGG